MSKFIDLGLLEQEPLKIKIKNGDIFEIPGEISTKFTIKLIRYSQEIENLKDEEKAFEKMQLLVIDILNLDKSKDDIDINYVEENIDDVRYLKAIVDGMMTHVKEISQDPNSNTPKSE